MAAESSTSSTGRTMRCRRVVFVIGIGPIGLGEQERWTKLIHSTLTLYAEERQ